MKKLKYTSQFIIVFASVLTVLTLGCERELSDDISLAKYPNTPEVFTDFPVSLTDQFFISFDPAEGANVNGFDVDNNAYKGTNAIRIDVPGSNDPEGGFIGGIFKDRFIGRDLTDYDALTFWAKGTTTASIGLFGFGVDFEGDKFSVGLEEIDLTTTWKQYIVPFPDPARLVQEKGMFSFSAGTSSTDGLGYTFWLDEIRFEKLGYFTQPRPAIFNANDKSVLGFNGSEVEINGTTLTLSLGNGSDVTTNISNSYFDFNISNPSVAEISQDGVVTIIGEGTTKITASINGQDAAGSLTLESKGDLELPSTPTHPSENVISIFSNQYENVNIDFYNGYWQPYQTTTSADFTVMGNDFLNYENFNFVGHQFSNPVIDATEMTHFHLDVFVPGDVPAGAKLVVTIKDFGPNGKDGIDDITQQFTIQNSELFSNSWNSIDIPLSLVPRTKLGQLIFTNGGSNLKNFYLDNVYFYKE